MRKSTILFAAACVFLALSPVFSSAGLIISSPKDRTITPKTRATINGTAVKSKEISINNVRIAPDKDGKFEAAALLRGGKNLVSVTAFFPGNEEQTKKVRILRVVTFDDTQDFSKGKPHWAKKEIVDLSTLGIIEGYPDNNFMPEQPITKGEIATWLARAKGLKVPAPKTDVYYDVPKEHWRARYIKAVRDAGYMKGASRDKFGIDEHIKRWEVVQLFVKAFGFNLPQKPAAIFPDVAKGSKYFSIISAAYNNGLVIGYPGKSKLFAPELEMKRAEAAILISSLPDMKARIKDLYDFGRDYTAARFSRIGTKPVILKANISPPSFIPDGATPFKLSVSVTDAQGIGDISMVWADLTPIEGPPHVKLMDKKDGQYELMYVMTTEVQAGDTFITVKAMDKAGLEGEGKVKFTVRK